MNKLLLLAACLIFFGLSSCAGSEYGGDRFAEIIASQAGTSGVHRADPGYMQYLERLSMLADASRLAQMISGSNFIWRRPSAAPNPEDLLERGGVWLYVNPHTIQTPGRSTPLAHLANPALWASLARCGINGLYLGPTGGGGNLWDHDLKRSPGIHDDTIQYSFAKNIGVEQDYTRIIEHAKAHGILLGGDLLPAATGIGPDFLLAVRNLRDYPGIYCLIEAPAELWPMLPAPTRSDGEMEVMPLDEEQMELLAGAGLFPKKMRQDAWAPYIESGWAATGEVRGGDGNLRRWVYRYADDIKRPLLNFGDPSGAARKVMLGSVVFQSAVLGNALNTLRLRPLLGLDSEAGSPAGPDNPASFSLFTGLSEELARQNRSYGSRSWIKDELPLPLIRAAMTNGPEFFQDSVFSPAAEHALLSGNAALLNFMADEALSLGLDWRRLVHGSIAHEGLSYALPHLRHLAGPAARNRAPDQRAGLAEDLLADTYAQVWSVAQGAAQEDSAPLFEKYRLYATPAGLAALALGLRDNTDLTPELQKRIRRGHMLLQFFKAMQPGVFMLSGQDLAGALPIDAKNLGNERLADKRLLLLGSFPLHSSAETGVFSSLGLPGGKNLYGSLDAQLSQPSSFARELGDLVALRQRLGLAEGTLVGRLKPAGKGVSALVTRLPASRGSARLYIASLVNFDQETSHESLNLAAIPELAPLLAKAGVTQLTGNLTSVRRQDKRLEFTAPGWSCGLVLIEENAAF